MQSCGITCLLLLGTVEPSHLQLVLPNLPVRGGQPTQHLQDALQEAEKVPSLLIGTHRSRLGRLGSGRGLARRARGRRRTSPSGERRARDDLFPAKFADPPPYLKTVLSRALS